jgi:hypothetical protein
MMPGVGASVRKVTFLRSKNKRSSTCLSLHKCGTGKRLITRNLSINFLSRYFFVCVSKARNTCKDQADMQHLATVFTRKAAQRTPPETG